VTTIGITGASGALGRRTAEYVLKSHPAADLVLFSRSPDSLAEFTDAGVTVRTADFDRPDSLADGFAGIDVLLLVSTDALERRTTQQLAAVAAAAGAGVKRIVYTSLPNAGADFPARLRPLSDSHAATEDALRTIGPSWTILRNALYFENNVGAWAQAVSTGRLVTNDGAGRHAPVSRDDCAAAAAAVLVGDGHDNVVYDIGGPTLVDDDAIAAVLAERRGAPVEVLHVDDDQYLGALTGAGLPEELASVLTGFGEAIRGGLLQTPIGDTERLIGRPPADLATAQA
jgi:NAD(P)H dehydrogenase (quinone)